MASLQDKVTIITGASSGIGESTALLFAESKAKVVLAARNVENLEKVASLCQSKGLSKNDILVIPCDVTNEENLKTLVDETVKKFGRIDVLINNAGRGNMGNVMATSATTLDDTMNTNFKSSYNLSRLCVPHLIKTQGSIVNVSSLLGQRAGPHISAYCIAKAALDMFTHLLALGIICVT
ncbi:dehydrogenase/reductase SDR family member 7-like isoform X1 [Mytilus trossulus]|uniref:dehydrogenase/reductase SDR family member 7-like isoform X1 n=1 Tax=Mytilus trossulus TaxID=6551 RepID=UPI0030047943